MLEIGDLEVLLPSGDGAVPAVRGLDLAVDRGEVLGVVHLGREVAWRLLFGARLSIGSAVAAGLDTALIGLTVGMLAGFVGGVLEAVLSRIIDVVLAFPLFLLALAITGVLGPGLDHLVVAVITVAWSGYARIARSAVLAERAKPYMESARAGGATPLGLLGRHCYRTSWRRSLYPRLAIFVLVLGLNLMGDGLRDALDPRVRR